MGEEGLSKTKGYENATWKPILQQNLKIVVLKRSLKGDILNGWLNLFLSTVGD